MRAYLISVICFVLATSSSAGATDLRNVLTGYTVTSWSQKDGLPPGIVYALAQDNEGYLWVATDDGPYRFDGVRFSAWSQESDFLFSK